MQIWQRLLDEHDTGISYSTIGHYRRSTINSHYRLNAAFRAGSDDSDQPQSPDNRQVYPHIPCQPHCQPNRPAQVRSHHSGPTYLARDSGAAGQQS